MSDRTGSEGPEEPPAGGGGRRSTGRSTAIFAAWTALSRVVGLAREILAAALYGTQGAINAFVIAFQVPNLLRSLVADSALSAAFVPVYARLQEEGRHREAERLVGTLIGVITLGLGGLSLVAIITAPWVMPLFAPGLPEDLIDELILLSRIMFPIVAMLGLTGLVAAVLQAAGEFGGTAFVPVLWNLVIIGVMGLATPFVSGGEAVTMYAVGIVLGTAAQLAWLVPSFRRKGRFPISLSPSGPHMRRVLVMMLPVTLGLGLINVNLSINSVFATLVSEESPRAIDAAFRIYLLPQGIFSVAVATVLFPAISRLAAREDRDGLRRAVSDGTRLIFFMLLPCSALLLVLTEPVVRLVFQRGEFDAASTVLTSEALFFFALGLAFNGASLLVIRAFFALQLPWTPTKVAGLGVVLTVVLNAVLYGPLGTGGITLATSITSAVTLLVLMWLLARELGGLHGTEIQDGILRCVVASGISALLAWSSWTVIDEALGRSTPAQIVAMTVAILAAVVAYLAAAQAFGIREIRTLSGLRRPLR
ncbi:MAG: murein biosynthesis integral membrane protein MurJ [Miltoncostaeaceae bacterium]